MFNTIESIFKNVRRGSTSDLYRCFVSNERAQTYVKALQKLGIEQCSISCDKETYKVNFDVPEDLAYAICI